MLKPIASWLAVALGLTGLASAQGAETQARLNWRRSSLPSSTVSTVHWAWLIDIEGYSTQRQDKGFLLIMGYRSPGWLIPAFR